MIHYHGTPLGGPVASVGQFLARRHGFVSFERPDQVAHVAEFCQSFALDNGAFSAWTRGTTVDVGAYQEWVSEWEQHPGFDWCVIPDLIDGSEAQNDALVEQWQRPRGIPVWHLHESIGRLKRLVDWFPRVALGSSGDFQRPGTSQWWARMDEALQEITDDDGRPWGKLHGLRMLDPAIFSRIPLSSADSTNAVRNSGPERFKTYRPIAQWQRAAMIADRVEMFNSAAQWEGLI